MIVSTSLSSISILMIIILNCVPFSISLPFVLLPGIGQSCVDKKVTHITNQLSKLSANEGYCLESNNGKFNSWFLPLDNQAAIVCNKVKEMEELKQGYHVVGLSQGSLIGRGVIEFCDGAPQVKNLITLAGPHAGTAASPFCYLKVLCFTQAHILNIGVYTNFVQAHLAPSGYVKIPNNVRKYQQQSKFLAKLNNEIPESRNSTYKERFMSLENLVLIKFDDDEVLNPRESSWFGYYPEGSFSHVLPPQQTSLYIEDWIGLKALDEAGKVKYLSSPGCHLDISEDDMKKHIVPYLTNKKTTQLLPYNVPKQNPKQNRKQRESYMDSKDRVEKSQQLESHEEAKHTSKKMSTQVMPYLEPKLTKGMPPQIMPYVQNKKNHKVSLGKVPIESGAIEHKNKDFLEHKEITPLVVNNWRPTFLKVRWQCYKYNQKIRR